MHKSTVGILGGGQLGRMMVESAHRLGIKIAILDPGGTLSPAGQLSDLAIEGDFNDKEKILELASVCDVLTIEIEHVNADPLAELEKSGRHVHPTSSTIKLIQDKYLQKVHLKSKGIAVGEFMEVNSVEECTTAAHKYGYPFVLKKKRLAYDGRGNYVVKNEADIQVGFITLGSTDLYAEKYIPFVKEIAVMVVRSSSGVQPYPVVETIQKDNICHLVISPALISEQAKVQAATIACATVDTFNGYGIFGVELFLLPDDSILLNEIAPRPHNSGHYTMEACETDQFEMHMRAILGLPCPVPRMKVGAALMVNVLGKATMAETKAELHAALAVPGVSVHWYGKSENKPLRKMAHYTVIADSMDELRQLANRLGIPTSVHNLPTLGPLVGIVMGSDSDLPTMKDAAAILDEFGISYELTIVSAHRTPNRMYTYAQSAVERGLRVIIAGAGGAAHLPGMIAALTTLPVIGVPVFTSTLHGQDSLLSIVQMPKGIPVATVAIGNSSNAGLLAVRMLGSCNPRLQRQMEVYMLKQEAEVLDKAGRLESSGHVAYLESMQAANAALK